MSNKRFATHWRVAHRKDPIRIPQELCTAMGHHFETALYVFERYILGWDPKKKRPLRSVYVQYACNV